MLCGCKLPHCVLSKLLSQLWLPDNTIATGRLYGMSRAASPLVLTCLDNCKHASLTRAWWVVSAQTQPLFKAFTDAWPAANGPEGGFTIGGAPC